MPAFDAEDVAQARQWLDVVRRPEVGQHLDAIYTMISDQVAARAPVCVASGRCCNFESYGHRLYATGLEAAWCVSLLTPDHPNLTPETVAAALERGGCPFQVGTLCGAHTIKPVGCRTYYCDPTAQQWQEDLTERAHAMVKSLHATTGVPYRYMEWRTLLALLADVTSSNPETRLRT